VTLPEATPVHEAAQLQEGLLRANIRTFGWIINQSLTPLTVTDPVLRARQGHEGVYIAEVVRELAFRAAIVPYRRRAATLGYAGSMSTGKSMVMETGLAYYRC
jgi:arsenite-transporting ATPase